MTENCMEERGGDPGMYREPDDVLNRIAVLSRTFLWQVDTSGIYTFVSDAVESILGYRPEELVGAVHFYDLHPDDGRDEFRETAFGAFSRKEPFRSVQNPMRAKDGAVLWFSTSAVPLLDGEGNLYGYRGTDTDITERRMAEEKLRESEARYSAIVENSPLGILLQDARGTIAFANTAFGRILGALPEELEGRCYLDFVHPEDRAESMRRISSNLADGRRVPLREHRFVRPDGGEVIVESTGTRIEQGGRTFVMSVFQDITVRRVQRAIADAMATSATLAGVVKVVRRELGELMDARNFLIAEYDDSTKMLFAQPSLSSDEKELVTRWSGEKSLTGMVIRNRHAMRFSKEEIRWLADQGAIDLVGARAEAWLGVPLQNRESVFGAIIVQSYDDPAAYDDGSMEVLQVVADQLSVYIEKKRMEDRLRESEARYSAIVENSPLGIMLQDAGGIVVYANPALAGMLGVSPEAIEGRPYLDFVHPDDREESRRRIDGNLADGLRIPLREHRYFHPDGREITVESTGTRIEQGGRTFFISIIRDVTQRKQAETEASEARRRLSDIIDFLPDATLAVDLEKKLIIWNRAIEEMTGIPASEMIGEGDYAYTLPFYGEKRPQLMDLVFEYAPETAARYAAVVRKGNVFEAEAFCPALHEGEGGWIFMKASPLRDGTGRITGAIESIRDISERKRFELLLAGKAEELERHQEAIIASMAILAEYRDHGTGEHVIRTKEYVRLLLERSGGSALYPPEHVPLLWQAAALHDIGKVGVPDMILLKPGKLTPAEFDVVKKHTVIGSKVLQSATRILGEVSFVTYARQITECHHEKWDGSGYPNGLKGEDIPFIARVTAIADVYDALVTERPYKKPIPHKEAVAVIAAGAGGHFDPRLVDVFLGCEKEFDAIARMTR